MSEQQEESRSGKPKGPSPRERANINPTPVDQRIIDFLIGLFPEKGGGFPEKIVLAVAYGEDGEKLGPPVREIPFKPNTPVPSRTELATMANLFRQKAQEDADAVGKANRYCLVAFDLARSDRPYERCVFRMSLSGTVPALDDLRGSIDDGAGAVLPTKLLLKLLDDERKDKRWMAELTMNTVSGAIGELTKRLGTVEGILDGTWDKQVKLVAATETALDQSEDRKSRAAWNATKREMMMDGYKFVRGLLPMVAAYASKGKVGIPQMLKDFLDSLTPEQADELFGADENGVRKGGIFTIEQVHFIAGLVKGEIDPRRAMEIMANLQPEQIAAVRERLQENQLGMLMAIAKAAQKAAEEEEKKNEGEGK